VTAILEAGRRSLDLGGAFQIEYDGRQLPPGLSPIDR
jgi:hypothetical protein